MRFFCKTNDHTKSSFCACAVFLHFTCVPLGSPVTEPLCTNESHPCTISWYPRKLSDWKWGIVMEVQLNLSFILVSCITFYNSLVMKKYMQLAAFHIHLTKMVTIPFYSKQLVYTICPLPISGRKKEYFRILLVL